jgi:hypothetical protein
MLAAYAIRTLSSVSSGSRESNGRMYSGNIFASLGGKICTMDRTLQSVWSAAQRTIAAESDNKATTYGMTSWRRASSSMKRDESCSNWIAPRLA